MCLPALRELRRVLPEADLTLVARPWVLGIFPTSELRCRTIAYDTRGQQGGLRGRWRFASQLRQKKFSAAILFQNALDAAVLATLSGIPVRAGYARQGRRPFLTHPVDVPHRREIPPHESNYYLELLRRLGLIPQLPKVEQILLPQVESDRREARAHLEGLLRRPASEQAGRVLEVKKILDQWYGPGYQCFRLRADDKNVYVLRHDLNEDTWTLDSPHRGAGGPLV